MAVEVGKLRGLARRGLGTPPKDAMPEVTGEGAAPLVADAPPAAPALPPQAETRTIVDGRTLRRSGRTVQLGTRVTEQFAIDLRADAAASNLLIVEVLEEAVEARRRLLALASPGETVEQVLRRLAAK